MEQRRLRAVLWDFDGTLVDSEPMWIEHEKDMLARHGASWPEEQFKAQIGEPAAVTAQRISESCSGAITVAQAYEELHARICARFEAGEIPFLPGARELLTDIRAHGVPCAMYTSSNKRIMSVIARVVPEFEFIVDGDDVKHPKPDPEGYLQAMRRLGVGPEEVVIIEDSVPGTDAAFLMALIHVWLRDNKYDKKFIEQYAVGLEELKQSVKDTTPLWQEGITGIKADKIERIANEIYAAAPAVIIDWGHKTTTAKAEYIRTRAIAIANALMGNVEKKGGIYFSKDSKTFNTLCKEDLFPTISNPDKNFKIPKTARIDGCGEEGSENFFVPRKHGVLMQIAPTILSEKPYPVKGWVSTRFNHLINVAGVDKSVEAIKKLDFVLAIDVYMSDFACLADVILPESTYLERDESIQNKGGTAPGFVMRNKAVEPVGDTKCGYEIFRELARVMKIDKDYTWNNIDEYRMQQAKGNAELIANLIKNGYVSYKVPKLYYREPKLVAKFIDKYPAAAEFVDENGEMSSQMKFKTPSGKIELFAPKVEELFAGYGCLNTEGMDVFGGHKYCLMSGKTALHTNGHTQNVKILNDMMSESPVWISPASAKAEGLKTGDIVKLKNKFGEQKAKIFVTQGIRDDCLFLYHGFGHVSPGLKRTNGIGTNQSVLLDPAAGPVVSTMVTNVGVDIVKI